MGSLVISTIIWYIAFLVIVWCSGKLNGTLSVVAFWLSFVLSGVFLLRLFKYLHEFFMTTFAKCHEVDSVYIDDEIKKYKQREENSK